MQGFLLSVRRNLVALVKFWQIAANYHRVLFPVFIFCDTTDLGCQVQPLITRYKVLFFLTSLVKFHLLPTFQNSVSSFLQLGGRGELLGQQICFIRCRLSYQSYLLSSIRTHLIY